MTIKNRFYEIKSPGDHYGLCGRFDTIDEALAEINATYVRALENGYDNKHERWFINSVKIVTSFLENGDFIGDEISRTHITTAVFNENTNAFVLVR
jgi:hypothetical protein